MEIQFSLPIVGSGGSAPRKSSIPRSFNAPPRDDATPRVDPDASNRGSTHRFALDTRTRHTRRSSTRARTGCSTCKKRHVKCDETKPSCLNCMKWRGYCDGYVATASAEDQSGSKTAIAAKLIHTKKAPTRIVEPDINTVRFENSDQRAYFDEWTALSVSYLSGGLNTTRLWTCTMPQLTLEEPTLRYGAMAIGALRKAYLEEGQLIGTALTTENKHYLNAIIYYCEALRIQSKARPSRENLRTAMLSSLLFICFETQRANMPAALKHITHGFSMLNELAACTDKADDLVSIAPAPPALVQEILDCYKPLELQSRSFVGSYKKFFFPPPPKSAEQTPSPPPSQGSNIGMPQGQPTGYGHQQRPSPPAQSRVSTPEAHWQTQTSTGSSSPSHNSLGLPSPQSQASPHNQGDARMSPPPQRPPGILPFSKHSPYFRPKQSHVKSLDEMPPAFSTIDEAQSYWSLLQKQMVAYVPVLTSTTARLNLTKVVDENELEMRLESVKQHPQIAKFVAESRYWLQRWAGAFDPLYIAAVRNNQNDQASYMQTANMRIEYLVLYIYTAIPRYSGLEAAKSLTPQYHEINVLAEMLLQAHPSCGFSMDTGWTWPLFIASFGCRDAAVRSESIRILGQYPIRNALRDSRVFRAIAVRNQQVESDYAASGEDEASQWLRLRRREIVFEDFGTNIIFRSSQMNYETGQWELVEEAASFVVQADGTLDWARQPLSESLSILAGIC